MPSRSPDCIGRLGYDPSMLGRGLVRGLSFALLIGLAALAVLGCGPADRSPEADAADGVIAPASSRPDGIDRFLQLPDDVAAVDFPWSEVVVERASRDFVLGVLVANTQERRARGMMYRSGLPPESGMLFVWEEAGPQYGGFWNPNVPIDLDVAWLDADGVIFEFSVLIAQDPTIKGPSMPYEAVLEMPRGRFAELGIALGDRIVIPPTLR